MERRNDSKVTIAEVARLADVSKTTISRYINGRYDMMSDDTRQRIAQVIESVGFRPSKVAQNLKSKHTKIIGCIIADITSIFSTHLVKGIGSVCEKNDYQVLFVNTNNDPEKEVSAIQSLIDSQVDGLIINTTGYNDEFIMKTRQSGMPIVMADRYLDKDDVIDSITSTNYKSTYECMEFLKNQGYDSVYFIGESVGNNKIRIIRQSAFDDACSTLFNIESKTHSYLLSEENHDENLIEFLRMVKREHPDENIALFGVNGMILLDLVVALKESGYAIGVDFGLCGFDDWRWAHLIEPGITTIRQDTYQIGVETANRILTLIQEDDNDEPKRVELPTRLMIRGSTTITK